LSSKTDKDVQVEKFIPLEVKVLTNNRPEEEVLKVTLLSTNQRFEFIEKDISSPAFFTVERRGGAVDVLINANHPFANQFSYFLDKCNEKNVKTFIEVIFSSWAKLELDAPEGPRRERISETRIEWSRELKKMINKDFF
jgi:hypothetical protein